MWGKGWTLDRFKDCALEDVKGFAFGNVLFPTPFLLSCQKKRCRTAKEKRDTMVYCLPLIDRR